MVTSLVLDPNYKKNVLKMFISKQNILHKAQSWSNKGYFIKLLVSNFLQVVCFYWQCFFFESETRTQLLHSMLFCTFSPILEFPKIERFKLLEISRGNYACSRSYYFLNNHSNWHNCKVLMREMKFHSQEDISLST